MAFTPLKERKIKQKSSTDDDLGFGNSPVSKNQRLMNADGSSNIRRIGLSIFKRENTYNWLITMSWPRFLSLLVFSFIFINILFAFAYNLIGNEYLKGVEGKTALEKFFDAFFFSAQTISTVGYGHISPKGFLTSALAATESMLGLFVFALATGLLYGRFSRPTAKIIYSQNMVICPYNGITGLMFRLANLRDRQLIELEIQVIYSYNEWVDGKKVRRFIPLNLERDKISILTMSWTVVHPIDENSVIFGLNKSQLVENEGEFLVLLKAFDDTFSQIVHTRTSYKAEDIIENMKFAPAFHTLQGETFLDLSRIGQLMKV
ncbi:MAG: K+ channel, inward rectifier [Flavobacteriaceae bacterium]|nr:K+ channel, inward rectifier [Flavobacteriaceae bacterium]